ncbi:hypothetical protein WH47_03581, partial [Habropoda laboriosa]
VPGLQRLTNWAIFGGFTVGAFGYLVRYQTNNKIRKTKTYKQALQMFYDQEKAVQYLGEPIKEGRIKINYRDTVRKISVNLRGANTKGQLDCHYTVKPDLTTEIKKLEMKFKNLPEKIFVIHEI